MDYIRSFLFAPGSNIAVMQKALNSAADAVILDLEDAVSIAEKETAREQVVDLLASSERSQRVYARINGWDTPWGRADLENVLAGSIDGIILPKAESPEIVAEVAGSLPQHCDFIPLVETARGLLNAYAVAACHERISRLAFGAVDFTADIGIAYPKNGISLLYARSQLVIVSRAADLLPPVDTVFPDLADASGFAAELDQVRQLGMFGKLAIHPKQLELIHAAFTPSRQKIAEAQKVVKAFENAERQGVAALEIEGQFVDYPVYRQALKLVALAGTLLPDSKGQA